MKISFVVLFLLTSTCFANDLQLGLMAGANYSNFQWNNSAVGGGFATTGYSGSGGVLLSFFEAQHLGFRISGIDNLVSSSSSGTGNSSTLTATVTGSTFATAATVAFNFDAGPGRHSIGVGYGYESLTSLSCTGTTSFPKASSGAGLVVDLKEVLKSGLFGYAQGFLPVDNLAAFNMISSVFVGVGYDFGQRSK